MTTSEKSPISSDIGVENEPKVRKTVSLERRLWLLGERRASQESRNFSNYVVWLIARDVETKGAAR